MNFRSSSRGTIGSFRLGLINLALMQLAFGTPPANANGQSDGKTQTPIKHAIIIIGENRTFDHVFATYKPRKGEQVWNLLSEGIVTDDGAPGENFKKAQQFTASDGGGDPFLLNPKKTQFPSNQLPAPLAGGPTKAAITTLADAKASENGLPEDYYQFLLTGGTGLKSATPDTRIANVGALPAGPFQLTPGVPYDAYAASPVHRFYQMWQQMDCSATRATAENSSGCTGGLFSWVEVTVGASQNGKAQPANFSTEYSANATTTGEGSTAMGFYNMQKGDAPYFKRLADDYAMSDNFHQSVQGGTGVNHIMFGHGDVIWFSDGKGHAATPPHHEKVAQGTANAGTVDEIEDPNPAPQTNNWYLQDGYGGGGSRGKASYGGGSYSNCADAKQPGVAAVVEYLRSLPRPIDPHCEAGHYYLLNNYNPGYFGDGKNAFTDRDVHNTVFTIPPSSVRSIGDSLNEKNISWKYYGDDWNRYLKDPYQINYGAVGANAAGYCNICNPFQYDTSIMSDPAMRAAHLQDTENLYADIDSGQLPAVSIVKPSGLVDGHPASSKLNLFEGFTKKIVDAVKSNPALWKDTAIFITFDEGGGYYDSGYVQPLDFFGDGTRIPLMVVSPYTKAGHISHEYTDHVSLLKFIERNWGLKPVSDRSRDNFPNPKVDEKNPYVPLNTPAIGDLFDLFDFSTRPVS
jgi:phospholipase C